MGPIRSCIIIESDTNVSADIQIQVSGLKVKKCGSVHPYRQTGNTINNLCFPVLGMTTSNLHPEEEGEELQRIKQVWEELWEELHIEVV